MHITSSPIRTTLYMIRPQLGAILTSCRHRRCVACERTDMLLEEWHYVVCGEVLPLLGTLNPERFSKRHHRTWAPRTSSMPLVDERGWTSDTLILQCQMRPRTFMRRATTNPIIEEQCPGRCNGLGAVRERIIRWIEQRCRAGATSCSSALACNPYFCQTGEH